MEANQLKARRKAQALEGIALLDEATKDLYSLLNNQLLVRFESYFIFVSII